MGTRTVECRKFSPNIFNKSKCSHCFRQRGEHSAAALELDRASRKVSKCGYLFVAPDWDFNNPLYRTKRWQRRWFVLYDDGELTYSVDEHPETVPQDSIDMTKALEVTTAEDVTGHSNSIAITAPDRVTFVKGTCPEESKWWLNALAAFPKAKNRHKRNATFPQVSTTNNRNRHNSYHLDTINSQSVDETEIEISSSNNWNTTNSGNTPVHTPSDQDENNKNAGNEITNRVYTDQPISSKSPPTRDKIYPESKAQVRIRNRNRNSPPSSMQQDDSKNATSCLLIEDVRRDEKLKDIANTLTNFNQVTKNNRWSSTTSSQPTGTMMIAADEKPTRDETDFTMIPNKDLHVVNLRPKSLPLTSSTAPAIVSAIVKKIPPVIANTNSSSTVETQSSLNLKSNNHHLKSSLKQQNNESQERGDPDGGCNLDDVSSNFLSKNSELRVNLPSEELLNSKKGWLFKQDTRTGEWTKHWFTLRGAALFYYRDPISEERGVLDGVLDVNSLTNVTEYNILRNYGILLTTWDKRRIILSSISLSSRNSWITALRNAAGIKIQTSTESQQVNSVDTDVIMKESGVNDGLKSDMEKDFMKAQRNQELIVNSSLHHEHGTTSSLSPNVSSTDIPGKNGPCKSLPIKAAGLSSVPTVVTTTPTTPVTPKHILFSSDEEYRTASEGGRRDSIDWGSPLSPSPPIPLAIFRAKEKLRPKSTSNPKMYKRSRSSPPNSRRSTVDSVESDELPIIQPVQEEINNDKELQLRLCAAEKERTMLQEEAREREARMSDLLHTLERTEIELRGRIREVEEVRDNLSLQLQEANKKAEQIIQRLTIEVENSQKKIKDLEDRLSRGIEENELLYRRLRELEGYTSSTLSNLNRSKMKRVDSLSDLTNLSEIDPYTLERDVLADEYHELRSRFEKAVNEIKAMKKELKESQNQYDTLEIAHAALKGDLERREKEDRCQIQMMAERIQDLTLKYSASERQVRTLKQKLAKVERRRSSSLKGKEQILVPKEIEEKVRALERKFGIVERGSLEKSASEEKIAAKKNSSSQTRRRSLENNSLIDSLQFMVRLNALEKRIEESVSNSSKDSGMNNNSSPKVSEHLIERLRSLEGILVSSKDRIEQSLQQLQSLRSSRTRRSVSPITDRKDSLKFVERCLTEVVKLIRESCETCVLANNSSINFTSTLPGTVKLSENSPIKLALMQLDVQLKNKLGDLLKQRRVLRERNELTPRKEIELIAERIAFESVCFGRLRDSLTRAEDPSLLGEKQTEAEIAETSQLMLILKAKLGGKCSFKPCSSMDILASVLAKRLILSSYKKERSKISDMPPVSPKIMEDLLRQQNEINLIAKRYKVNTMETLASCLAAETLSYISSTDAVQGAVQEAWRQAQETVNAELVQSEIAHVMMRHADRFENSITPSFGYSLTAEERVTFENFADAVHDTLRREMDSAIEELTQCYEESLQKLKHGQWRLHLEHERKASEGRLLLAEFADIIAHKALIDARVAILQGDFIAQCKIPEEEQTAVVLKSNITALQKYENLFEELANDFHISNADDILAEADFNFMYKNFTTEFISSDKPQLKEISVALNKLEESIAVLQSTLNPDISTSIMYFDFESLQEISIKCRELRERIENIIAYAQRASSPCKHCQKMQDNIYSLAEQHETEMKNLQKIHSADLTVLREEIEEHVRVIKELENEKNSLIEELSLQSNLVEDHERELAAVIHKLKCKEDECRRRENENLDLIEKIENQENNLKKIDHDREDLKRKCLRQDEEYAALLQERDYIQAELNKERERSKKLEKRLEMLELEHSRQLECLQEAYKDQLLSHCSEFAGITDEESFRQRYQTEIEQLRTLCEKGLAAMESSHRRIVTDLEEKHRKEIERLLFEKEQALAEETQATLAALDAMRKAHQSEVQREVARFKQEFLRQFQKGDNSGIPIREKEEELEELRQEILSFSEKYSIKCVENAALEEKLRAANQKLKQLQQMQQLELRNKQFKAHLASEDFSSNNFVQGLAIKDDQPCPDSEHDYNNKLNVNLPSSSNPPIEKNVTTNLIKTCNKLQIGSISLPCPHKDCDVDKIQPSDENHAHLKSSEGIIISTGSVHDACKNSSNYSTRILENFISTVPESTTVLHSKHIVKEFLKQQDNSTVNSELENREYPVNTITKEPKINKIDNLLLEQQSESTSGGQSIDVNPMYPPKENQSTSKKYFESNRIDSFPSKHIKEKSPNSLLIRNEIQKKLAINLDTLSGYLYSGDKFNSSNSSKSTLNSARKTLLNIGHQKDKELSTCSVILSNNETSTERANNTHHKNHQATNKSSRKQIENTTTTNENSMGKDDINNAKRNILLNKNENNNCKKNNLNFDSNSDNTSSSSSSNSNNNNNHYVGCKLDKEIQLESILSKRCSPPPLNERDVEHLPTSHLRRFELEI